MAKLPKRPVDMALSLAVILVPLVLVMWFFTRPVETPVRTVDWQPVVTQARQEAPYPVLAPVGLPETWRVTKAQWQPTGQPGLNRTPAAGNTWQFGALSPDDVYYWLAQRDTQPDGLVDQLSRSGYSDGTSTIKGTTWQRYLSPDGRTRALVNRQPGYVTVVAADISYEGVEAFVSTLGG